MKAGIAIGIALLAGLGGTLASANLTDDEITAAEAAAKAGAATTEGRKLEESLGQAFGRDHGVTIGGCAKAARRPDLADFELFLRLDAVGVVERALVRPATNVSDCVQRKLAGWKATVPPHAGFWVRVGVKLKRK